MRASWVHCIPLRLPNGLFKYRINERCLTAPKPYLDADGFYAMPPWRRVRPGLVKAPAGFQAIDTVALTQALKELIDHRFKMDEIWHSAIHR